MQQTQIKHCETVSGWYGAKAKTNAPIRVLDFINTCASLEWPRRLTRHWSEFFFLDVVFDSAALIKFKW